MAASSGLATGRLAWWYVLLAALTSAAFAWAALQLDLAVNYLGFDVVAAASAPVGLAAALAGYWFARGAERRRLAWLLAIGGTTSALALAAFLVLWSTFVCVAPDYARLPRRFLVGSTYNELVRQGLALARQEPASFQEPTVQELLRDNDYDPRQVFEERSLLTARLALESAWLVLVAAALGSLGVLGVAYSARRLSSALLEQAARRLESWPAEMPVTLSDGMRKALEAMTHGSQPNAAASILTAASIFEGRHGLLGELAATRPEGRSEANWKKWRDFDQQIDAVAALGILRYDVLSELHVIRMASNNARHRRPLATDEVAAMTLLHAIRVIEWYAFVSDDGPKLPNPPAGVVEIAGGASAGK